MRDYVLPNFIRSTTALLVAPVLIITGTRFSRYHRVLNNMVYKLIDTPQANKYANSVIYK